MTGRRDNEWLTGDCFFKYTFTDMVHCIALEYGAGIAWYCTVEEVYLTQRYSTLRQGPQPRKMYKPGCTISRGSVF